MKISESDRKHIEPAWKRDSTRVKAALEATDVYRQLFAYAPDEDSSEEAAEIGVMVGERKGFKSADHFINRFEKFLDSELEKRRK